VNVSVIGLGYWGPNLVRCLSRLGDCRIVAACDASPKRLEAARMMFPQIERLTLDPQDAITDRRADAVMIATPAATHFDLVQQALKAEKHVFVEKPMCVNSRHAAALVELALARRRHLAVGHVYLFHPVVAAVRGLIRIGRLGRVRTVHAVRANRGPVRNDVNVLWDLASHDLSILQHWFDADAITVTATAEASLRPPLVDVARAQFGFGDGLSAQVHVSWLYPCKVRSITLVGEHGTLVWNELDLEQPLRVTAGVPFAPPRISTGDAPLLAECRHFQQCVRGVENPQNDAQRALRIVCALEAADRSLAGSRVPVNVDYSSLATIDSLRRAA